MGGDWNNLNLYRIWEWWQYSVDIIGTTDRIKIAYKNMFFLFNLFVFYFFSFTHDSGISFFISHWNYTEENKHKWGGWGWEWFGEMNACVQLTANLVKYIHKNDTKEQLILPLKCVKMMELWKWCGRNGNVLLSKLLSINKFFFFNSVFFGSLNFYSAPDVKS